MNDTRLIRRTASVGIAFGDTLPERVPFDTIVVDELEHAVVPSTPLLRERLDIDAPEVLMIEQTVHLDAHPLLLQTTYHRLDDAELSARILAMNRAGRSVPFDEFFLRMFGIDRGRSTVSIEAVRCDERTAALLDVEVSSPLLVREIVYFDARGTPRAVGYSHFKADRVTLRQIKAG